MNKIDISMEKDQVRVEARGVINQELKKDIIECFNSNFFKEIKEILDNEAEQELNRITTTVSVKNDVVLGSGWPFWRAEKIQAAIARSKYGDIFVASSTRLGEIRKNRIGLSITTGKDIDDVTKPNKKYLRERASLNHKLEGQMRLEEELAQVTSTIPEYIEQQYDLTGVLLYHMDDKNRIEVLKVIFLDVTTKVALLVLHAPTNLLYTCEDIIENEETTVIDNTNIKQEEYSLKSTLQIK